VIDIAVDMYYIDKDLLDLSDLLYFPLVAVVLADIVVEEMLVVVGKK
jgi:hypothetical protein